MATAQHSAGESGNALLSVVMAFALLGILIATTSTFFSNNLATMATIDRKGELVNIRQSVRRAVDCAGSCPDAVRAVPTSYGKWALRTSCDADGPRIEVIRMANAGTPALDPLTKKPYAWMPLSGVDDGHICRKLNDVASAGAADVVADGPQAQAMTRKVAIDMHAAASRLAALRAKEDAEGIEKLRDQRGSCRDVPCRKSFDRALADMVSRREQHLTESRFEREAADCYQAERDCRALFRAQARQALQYGARESAAHDARDAAQGRR